MPTSFSHIDLCLVTFPLPLLRLLQNFYCYVCHHYRYFHTTLLLNTLLQILSLSGVVELTTQQLILENILWLPLCRINKFGLNTLPSKIVVIPYSCGLSVLGLHGDDGPLRDPPPWPPVKMATGDGSPSGMVPEQGPDWFWWLQRLAAAELPI